MPELAGVRPKSNGLKPRGSRFKAKEVRGLKPKRFTV
jgi:hypothetical protein